MLAAIHVHIWFTRLDPHKWDPISEFPDMQCITLLNEVRMVDIPDSDVSLSCDTVSWFDTEMTLIGST